MTSSRRRPGVGSVFGCARKQIARIAGGNAYYDFRDNGIEEFFQYITGQIVTNNVGRSIYNQFFYIIKQYKIPTSMRLI
jgi:hypothetical protein